MTDAEFLDEIVGRLESWVDWDAKVYVTITPAERDRLVSLARSADALRGAMAADDERLRAAERRVWRDPDMTWGCDAAEHMADTILTLRTQLDELTAGNMGMHQLKDELEQKLAEQAEELRPLRCVADAAASYMRGDGPEAIDLMADALDALRAEVERLAGLLHDDRDRTTAVADAQSWEEQCEMARDTAVHLGRELDTLRDEVGKLRSEIRVLDTTIASKQARIEELIAALAAARGET